MPSSARAAAASASSASRVSFFIAGDLLLGGRFLLYRENSVKVVCSRCGRAPARPVPGGGMIRLLAALTLVAAAARAQPTPPCPACNEDPADVSARVLYERAVRAEYDGRKDDALREAQACLDQRPAGRFAAAAQDLIARVKASPRVASAAGVGPRT